MRDVGLEPLIHQKATPRIGVQPGGFQVEQVGVGLAAHGIEKAFGAQPLAALQARVNQAAFINLDAGKFLTQTKHGAPASHLIAQCFDDLVIDEFDSASPICEPLTLKCHQAGKHRLNAILGFGVSGILTLGLIISLILLIKALPEHKEWPESLLLSAASLWITNILVFALWYWRLDAGGPHQRDKRSGHSEGSFLFPQMTMSQDALEDAGQENWSPNFVDYLFLAFNTNTAFSPTDAPVLARWAKVLMMLQSLLSLLIIALLAARAVNIL